MHKVYIFLKAPTMTLYEIICRLSYLTTIVADKVHDYI